MIDNTLISFVSALTALIASIAGPFVTLHATRTQIKATVRSANRQRWIDEFRDTIARFCSEIAIAAQGRDTIVRDGRIVIQGESEFLHAYGRLIYTANKLRLMINPLEPEHQELLDVTERLFALLRTTQPDHASEGEGLLIIKQITIMSVAIIRREWLRVQDGE